VELPASRRPRKVFEEVSKEWVVKQGKVWDEIDKEGYDFAKKRGNQVIALSKDEDAKWAKAVRPLLDEHAKALKGKGLPGDEAVKFAVDFLKKN
jgi:TRAP-type C4-dicarboxylate transport system substrate-binding protein